VFSRQIVAWHAATIKDVSMVTTPLRMALWHRAHDGRPVKAPELSHHSDAESQYASIRLTERLSWEHVVASIGSVGGAYENALIESANDIYRPRASAPPSFHASPYKTIADVEFATAPGSTGTTAAGCIPASDWSSHQHSKSQPAPSELRRTGHRLLHR
jgi:putative transposase